MGGALDFIEAITMDGSTVSIGHSDADTEVIKNALERGAVIFTHLFNGMRGIHHRDPRVAGAALLSDAYVELICDGIHVHPDIVKLAYRLKGKDRIVIITDAMHAKGLGDGTYSFCGSKIIVADGEARMEDGALAGGMSSMLQNVRNMVRFAGATLEEAVQMATENPARVVGVDSLTGSLEKGKRADILVLDDSFEIESVFIRGKKIK